MKSEERKVWITSKLSTPLKYYCAYLGFNMSHVVGRHSITSYFSHEATQQTEYLSFMKYVYQDVEKWLRCGEIENDLCGYNEIVALTEFLEELQNVYVSN